MGIVFIFNPNGFLIVSIGENYCLSINISLEKPYLPTCHLSCLKIVGWVIIFLQKKRKCWDLTKRKRSSTKKKRSRVKGKKVKRRKKQRLKKKVMPMRKKMMANLMKQRMRKNNLFFFV